MIRTQIQLDEDQHAKLKALSARSARSMAELVRQGVERVLSEAESADRWSAAWKAVGCGRDVEGRRDVAERHDDYLADAYRRG